MVTAETVNTSVFKEGVAAW